MARSAPVTKDIGMYVANLAGATASGLYPALVRSCGPEHANFLMDFASYSIQQKSNVAAAFENTMKRQLLFSKQLYSDSWISDFFAHKLQESSVEEFKVEWVKECVKRGITEVWLCMDGQDNDCASRNVIFAEKGHAKSGTKGNICSCLYAVGAEDGTPITYNLYREGRLTARHSLKRQLSFGSMGFTSRASSWTVGSVTSTASS